MNVFLDLEKTIIEDWTEPFFLEENILFINSQLELIQRKFNPSSIKLVLFSFAVDNNHSFEIFERNLRSKIEVFFSAKFIKVFLFSKENLFQLAEDSLNIKSLPSDHITDLFTGNMKEQVFEALVNRDFKGELNVLFDDTVKTSFKEVFEDSLFSQTNKTTLISISV